MIEPPSPPKYSSIAQSVADGAVTSLSRCLFHTYPPLGSETVTYNSYLVFVVPSYVTRTYSLFVVDEFASGNSVTSITWPRPVRMAWSVSIAIPNALFPVKLQ